MNVEPPADKAEFKSKKELLVDERREQIIDVAIRLFSDMGFYRTTIEKIAEAGGFSQGFIYRYFKDKDDLLFHALSVVLDSYETEIPPRLLGIKHPIDRLCATVSAFCAVVDSRGQATVLAYRSTRSLTVEQQKPIMMAEEKTNQYLRDGLDACIRDGYMVPVDEHLMVYQYLLFSHSWALKRWAFKDRYTIDEYVIGGLKLLVKPFLTPQGLDYWMKYYEDT
jgi:TetR/AcrR family transcriptional regulator, cholesterol catabolism regulator